MMVLYSGTTCPFSQRCRLVLFEKGMDFQVIDVDMFNKPEDLSVMNPYNRLPVLVERDLILYESNIINEYIDERFPHPQLMPADPVMRARTRLFLFNFERELFIHVQQLERRDHHKDAAKHMDRARQQIRDRLTQLTPIFLNSPDIASNSASPTPCSRVPESTVSAKIQPQGAEPNSQARSSPTMKPSSRAPASGGADSATRKMRSSGGPAPKRVKISCQ